MDRMLIISTENQLRKYGSQLFAVLIPPLEASKHRIACSTALISKGVEQNALGLYFDPIVKCPLNADSNNVIQPQTIPLGLVVLGFLGRFQNRPQNRPVSSTVDPADVFLDSSRYIHSAGNADGISADAPSYRSTRHCRHNFPDKQCSATLSVHGSALIVIGGTPRHVFAMSSTCLATPDSPSTSAGSALFPPI
ncbi:hypothetical protein PILCRDRAFT_11104 [Piloderma croceum F 1598]|uniref:Uncharacterized protein n=1 Tax=Piloderma croceum (strain F 1598) TaxID=765440 RepID=A0A0C3BMY8_PILCF|nr:hypothetical protein PILCRDRAFT_11104 [Piloderma croceum F 1598]